jgi:hypothetical protein
LALNEQSRLNAGFVIGARSHQEWLLRHSRELFGFMDSQNPPACPPATGKRAFAAFENRQPAASRRSTQSQRER